MTRPTDLDQADRNEPGDSPPATPRWVVLLGVVLLVLGVAFVTLHLVGGGLGPGVHTPMQHAP